MNKNTGIFGIIGALVAALALSASSAYAGDLDNIRLELEIASRSAKQTVVDIKSLQAELESDRVTSETCAARLNAINRTTEASLRGLSKVFTIYTDPGQFMSVRGSELQVLWNVNKALNRVNLNLGNLVTYCLTAAVRNTDGRKTMSLSMGMATMDLENISSDATMLMSARQRISDEAEIKAVPKSVQQRQPAKTKSQPSKTAIK